MSVKFRSPLELSAHRAIAHSDAAQTLAVTVAAKTAAHPEHGNGSSNGYVIDGVEGAYLEFTPGNTYKFDQSHSSNSGHPLRFYEDAAKTTAYTTGVTTSGTPGNSGAYTQIIPSASTPPILYYQCSAHALMGSYTKFGTGSQGDTYTLSATQDGDNVDILLDAGSGTDSTVQLTAGNNITLTRSSAQEVEIAASGGGGGTVTVQKNVYTANGSTTTFNTSTAIVNENNVQVYIDGVYQSKDNYTTSGSTVTMSTAPPNTTSVELIHMVAVDGVIARDSFTGNGSTTAYVLSMSISNENATQVYLDGVYQSKDNYSTSGSTLTFSTAPPNGTAIEVVHIKAVSASSLNQNNFTGNGSTTAFTLSQSIDDEAKTFVFIQGVYQEKSTYSISGTTLTFTTAPQNGYTVEVMAFSTITVGNASVSATSWQSAIKTSSFTAEKGKGYFVNTSGGAITVTLPLSPSLGDTVAVSDYGGNSATNKITFTSSNNIQGGSGNKVLSTNNGSVKLVYSDSTKGWVTATDSTDGLSGLPASVDYLVVAGGGGGGGHQSATDGGGGAGGLRTSYGSNSGGGTAAETALQLILATNYTITVGAGGSLGSGTTSPTNGENSSIVGSNITDIISLGGGGASANAAHASSGGSGGGGSNGGGQPGQGTAGQGYAGGSSNSNRGGGGGGAGAVGANSPGNNGGAGGIGLAVNIINATNAGTANVGEVSSSNVYYAGGGGGGSASTGASAQAAGGLGGGGNGEFNNNNNATAGDDNTGGGGGGAFTAGAKAGGSGVVILRYASTLTLTAGAGLTQSTGSPFTEGSDKISVFTAGTGIISLN